MSDYAAFLERKSQVGNACGFEPLWMPDFLFPFQAALEDWSIRKGRAAVLADCGLGKGPLQLVWSENVVRHTNGRVLILAPIAVSHQFVREGEKFGVQVTQCRDGKVKGPGVYVTNYEKLHLFNPSDFAAVSGDEAGCLKNFDGKTRAAVAEFMRTLPYRLLCSATMAPNDYDELGNAAECLGEMGYQDMVSRYFKKETKKDFLGWGRTNYKLRGHAERDFWRWVCSWARAVRRPSDLGFDDGPFQLPELIQREHVVECRTVAPGHLFDVPPVTLQEQRDQQRRTLRERCERVAGLVAHDRPAVCWTHLNDEADLLEEIIPDAEQVSGSDRDEVKEEKFLAFAAGQLRVLISKPKIAAFGLNWQHCDHMTYFPSHSYEQMYQGIRRCWRFGQKNPVTVDVVTTEGGAGVLANLRRKQEQADHLFAELVRLMNDPEYVARGSYGTTKMEAPAWL